MNIILHYTEKLVRKAAWRFITRIIGWKFPAAIILMLIFFLAGLKQGDNSWKIGVSGVLLAISFIFPIVIYRNQLRAALFKFRALNGKPVVFHFSDTNFSIRSDAGSTELPWNTITDVWRYDDCWLIFFSKAHFMTFPLEGVTSEKQLYILKNIQSNGGKVA